MMRRTKVGDLVYLRFRVIGSHVDQKEGPTIRLEPVKNNGEAEREGEEYWVYDEGRIIHQQDAARGIKKLIQLGVLK